RQTGLRHTPSLSFVRDTLPEGAQHMEDLVARARAADAALAAAREGAQPAGDPDPYRPAAGAAGDERDGDDEQGGADEPAGRQGGGPRPAAWPSPPSPRGGPPTTSWRASAAGPARAGWAPRGRLTRWRPGCWWSASRRPPACSVTWHSPRRSTWPRSGWAR